MKSIIAICLILGLASSVFATESANTAGSAFVKGPSVVLDTRSSGGNTTDAATTWATTTPAGIRFGPGASNDTIYLWGSTFSSTALATLSRKINATQIAVGTSSNTVAEESVVSGSSAAAGSATSLGTARSSGSVVYGTGPGVYIVARAETVSSTLVDVLALYYATPGAAAVKALATSTASSTSGEYSYAPLSVWVEDSTYYCLYEAQSLVSSVYAVTGIYIQGVYANGTVVYTTAALATITTSVGILPTALGVAATTGTAGGNNNTNSSLWLVAYKDPLSTASKYTAVTVSRAMPGVVTSVYTATDATTSGSAQSVTYLGGVVPSNINGSYGFIVGVSATAAASGSTASYNISVILNSTTMINSGITVPSGTGIITTSGYTPGGYGFRYGAGYGVIGYYSTASTTTVAYINTFYQNGTANTNGYSAATSVGTFDTSTPVSFFDLNGTLWCGYGTNDGTDINRAYIGELNAALNATWTASGSALTAIVALLSFVIMSLFMF